MQQRQRLLLAELLRHLQLTMNDPYETPWAIVQRMTAQLAKAAKA